jgi:threonine dehydrogenase-like Zn-dependent dehydrogenase
MAANINCLKVPAELDDEHAILLTDILPTAWHANELGRVGKGDNVAIWGSGPGTYYTSNARYVLFGLECCNKSDSS